MSKEIVLTGITTTGTPHLGNYVGAIRPAVEASRREDVQSFYFLADFHALVKSPGPDTVHRSSLEWPRPGWRSGSIPRGRSSIASPTCPRSRGPSDGSVQGDAKRHGRCILVLLARGVTAVRPR